MLEFKSYMEAVKRELGFRENDLVFIGMADTAHVRWCEQKAVYMNREMELPFFVSFLTDVLDYALKLGYISEKREPPAGELLELRNGVSFDDIERLLSERKPETEEEKTERIIQTLISEGWVDYAPLMRGLLEKRPRPLELIKEIKGLDPKLQGIILEYYSEDYPSIRWNFDWDGYVVVGVPDGITDRFVYEYKTTGSGWLLQWMKPVAILQADIYGYFFRRKERRVQIMVRKDGIIHTWHGEVDKNYALDSLKMFREVEKGERKPIFPAGWKCKGCGFKNICEVRANLKSPPPLSSKRIKELPLSD